MSQNRNRQREQRPVFVDASGRRQRRLRVAGAITVLPAVGYVSLLLSTVLGGPTIHAPFLPLPAPPAAVSAQHPKPATTSSTTSDQTHPLAVDVASTRQFGDPGREQSCGAADPRGAAHVRPYYRPDARRAEEVDPVSPDAGEGQTDVAAHTSTPADQALTMTHESPCDPSV